MLAFVVLLGWMSKDIDYIEFISFTPYVAYHENFY